MASKVNREFGNILRKNKNRERGIQYSSYIKLRKEEENKEAKRLSFHERFKIRYGSNYMSNWRK